MYSVVDVEGPLVGIRVIFDRLIILMIRQNLYEMLC